MRRKNLYADQDNAACLRVASAGEIIVRHKPGKPPLPEPPREFIRTWRMAGAGMGRGENVAGGNLSSPGRTLLGFSGLLDQLCRALLRPVPAGRRIGIQREIDGLAVSRRHERKGKIGDDAVFERE